MLEAAIAAWRADRSSVALANRVDELSAQLARLPVPNKVHPWWVAHALAYDPAIATTLLATLHTQARDHHVAWRTIIARDTPLARELHARGLGAPDAVPRSAWLNLVDRIGLMLAWPDDPRVALVLAEIVHAGPFFRARRRPPRHVAGDAVIAACLKRIAAIGDLRALARLDSLWHHLDEPARHWIANATARAPAPRTPEGTSVDVAWHAVLDEPDALAPRLVLADAYMQCGDPRGEVMAWQCAPFVAIEKARAAGNAYDANALFGVRAEEIYRRTQANWYRWLGEAALVVARSSVFRAGLLSEVHVGHAATPAWA